MSDTKEKDKEPVKDVTGQELSEKSLEDVAGGMRIRGWGVDACNCGCLAGQKDADYKPDANEYKKPS